MVLIFLSHPGTSCFSQVQPVPGAVDTRTTFSDGTYEPEALVQLAKSRGLGVLFFNDHDRVAMEYGLPPLRNILKRKVERNSINLIGPDRYLETIRNLEKKYPDMILIPGSETAPFYYWTGSLLKGNLTAHNPERRLLTIGMENPRDYENLPILHNDSSVRKAGELLPGALLLLLSLILSFFLFRWRGLFRMAGILISLSSVALFFNALAAEKTSPFDPYRGDPGIAPYQLLIDYVNSKGALTFWNYPETKSGNRKMGPVWVSTPPYPAVLEDSRGYTGFSALYGDTITLTEPGNIWDLTLKEYCRGLRERPPWGIATSDFHQESASGEKLGNFQTVFLLRERTKAGVLDAMRNGRMYACRGNYPQVPRLDEFSVSSAGGEAKAISGEEILLKGRPELRISVSGEKASADPVRIRIIRSGQLVKVFESALPAQIYFQDDYFQPGEKIYYRVDMRGAGMIVSNPIFVTFETRHQKE